jgi:glycosyltransferase involved in cell wall biosynthesis
MTLAEQSDSWPKRSASPERLGIVMRTKDRPVLLYRAIASVLLQDFEAWHLYLVNDGGDSDLVDYIVKKHAPMLRGRCTVIHHADSKGMEAASNAALAASDQDFIVVHDDDDAWHPNYAKSVVSFLDKPENARFLGVCTGCTVVTEVIQGAEVIELERHDWLCEGSDRGIIDFALITTANRFPPISFTFRKEALRLAGGFDDKLPVLGDWDFNLRVLSYGDIAVIKKPLAYYHVRRDQKRSGAYANTDVKRHEHYNTVLRNRFLRQGLEGQAGIGLVQALAHTLSAARPNGVSPPFTSTSSTETAQILDLCYHILLALQLGPDCRPRWFADHDNVYEIIKASPLFDSNWYLERNPDVAAEDCDPCIHYIEHGASEGRDPGPFFSTRGYLNANPDVSRENVNPLFHYIRYGFLERRRLG